MPVVASILLLESPTRTLDTRTCRKRRPCSHILTQTGSRRQAVNLFERHVGRCQRVDMVHDAERPAR
ncbi:hypothetical protein trd_A0633 (plasmid) [Thermomicrobium roseum DSM 5159]|uniref:Uncharacterized protein n=1 Tax=Thermomicrobium roseum (strain ATCC 27502 / DSM 5159 / P-2) TaxID=309801 RepID=B9L4B9_THERP|nr:hypothetical protein trd_A0633 [Thermomicrobium roseum DSM 5159]